MRRISRESAALGAALFYFVVVTDRMPDSAQWATIIGFLSLMLTVTKLWWDNRTMKEGMRVLYKIVESNQRLVETFTSQLGHLRVADRDRIALEKNRLDLEKMQMVGKTLRWLHENG